MRSCLSLTGLNGICGSQGMIGDYKDAGENMTTCLHANHGVQLERTLAVLIMFVKTFGFSRYDTYTRNSIQRHKLNGDTRL
jgi:hypothetical protein